MRSIGVFATSDKPGARDLLRQLAGLAEAHSITLKVQSGCALAIDRSDLACADDDAIASCDVLVTLSGDGGVLGAARAAAPHGTPILAVDLGRLGFLSSVRPTELESAFHMLRAGSFRVEERMMLDARVLRNSSAESSVPNRESAECSVLSAESSNSDTLHHSSCTTDSSALSTEHSALSLLSPLGTVIGGSIGLNDAVVAKSALARILRLSIYAGGDLVAETRADGLIISTPTGSTAYALSAGGPILHPDVPSLLICPICAHSLNQRPLVVDSHETIEVQAEWEGDEVSSTELEAMLTIDGQIGISLQSGDVVQVQRAELKTRLLLPPHVSFYDRLREKMRWGR